MPSFHHLECALEHMNCIPCNSVEKTKRNCNLVIVNEVHIAKLQKPNISKQIQPYLTALDSGASLRVIVRKGDSIGFWF